MLLTISLERCSERVVKKGAVITVCALSVYMCACLHLESKEQYPGLKHQSQRTRAGYTVCL